MSTIRDVVGSNRGRHAATTQSSPRDETDVPKSPRGFRGAPRPCEARGECGTPRVFSERLPPEAASPPPPTREEGPIGRRVFSTTERRIQRRAVGREANGATRRSARTTRTLAKRNEPADRRIGAAPGTTKTAPFPRRRRRRPNPSPNTRRVRARVRIPSGRHLVFSRLSASSGSWARSRTPPAHPRTVGMVWAYEGARRRGPPRTMTRPSSRPKRETSSRRSVAKTPTTPSRV